MKAVPNNLHRFDVDEQFAELSANGEKIEDSLAERGIMISYETVRRWVNHSGPKIAADLRKCRPKPQWPWSICGAPSTPSAFILAETGLVAGRSVSTHRVCAEALAKRFPEISVDTKQRIIDDGDRSGSRYRKPHSMPRGDKTSHAIQRTDLADPQSS